MRKRLTEREQKGIIMNELTINNEAQTISARSLYESIGSSERFSSWFERQLQFGFTEGDDFTSVKSFTVVNNGARREIEDYDLSIDMAKEICMVQRSEKAREVRKYLIDLEKAWNTPEQVMARALKLADEKINSLKLEVVRMRPKEIFADAVAASNTSILIGELAKIICQNGYPIGQNRLFTWMRDRGYLMKYGENRNMPIQRYVEMGLFEIKESNIQNPDGSVRITRTTKVTGKGQQYFVNKFLGDWG